MSLICVLQRDDTVCTDGAEDGRAQREQLSPTHLSDSVLRLYRYHLPLHSKDVTVHPELRIARYKPTNADLASNPQLARHNQ